MKKTLKILVLAVLLISIASSVKAYTNDELITYLTTAKNVAGETVSLTADERGAVRKYLQANPLTDAEAASVKSQVDSAIAVMNAAGTTDVTKLSEADKEKIKSYATSAAKIADVEVSFDTSKKAITVKDTTGKTIFSENYSTRKAITYTGANYVMYIVPVVAIIAVAMFVIIKKSK